MQVTQYTLYVYSRGFNFFSSAVPIFLLFQLSSRCLPANPPSFFVLKSYDLQKDGSTTNDLATLGIPLSSRCVLFCFRFHVWRSFAIEITSTSFLWSDIFCLEITVTILARLESIVVAVIFGLIFLLFVLYFIFCLPSFCFILFIDLSR